MTAPRPKLDIDVTREKLTALGCGYAAAALEPLLAGDCQDFRAVGMG